MVNKKLNTTANNTINDNKKLHNVNKAKRLNRNRINS